MQQPQQSTMEQLYNRMVRAAKLDVTLFREVEADLNATGQGAIVVVIAAIAAGIGQIGISGGFGLVLGILSALAGWVVLAALTYWIGVNVLPKPETHADWGQLARTLAFAQSAAVLKVFGVIGVVSGLSWIASIFVFAISVWTLVASVIAVREALDYGQDTVRAIGVVALAFIPYVIIFWLIGLLA